MPFEYQYGIYNPGQYPAETKETWDRMVAEGWQVSTAVPNFSEIYILWERELPEPEPSTGGKKTSKRSGRPSQAPPSSSGGSSGASASV